MKKFKKLLAVMLAAVMVLAMAVPGMAAEPSNDDKSTISVVNVEQGATVTAYRIAEPEYNTQGLTGFKAVTGATIADLENLTAEEITTIAQNIINGTLTPATTVTLTYDADSKSYKNTEAPAGMWLVLVTGNVKNIYNPMVVSNSYEKSDDSSTLGNKSVDASGQFNNTGYAKSSTPTVEKKIVDSGNNDKGDDVAFGDTVKFQIDTTIPSYTKDYKNITFTISDTLDDGFTLPAATAVEVKDNSGNTIESTGYTTTINGQNITIAFTRDYILKSAGQKIVVTYSAKLDKEDKVTYNYEANKNTVKVIYSNDPKEDTTGETEEKKTYHYTFGIDGFLNGKTSKKTNELFKVEGGKIVKVEGDTITSNESPLANAEFKLTNKATKKEYTGKSDAQGRIEFTGLDAGTYTLVETKAPDTYSLDAITHTVVISANYYDDGHLKDYTVKIDESESTYSATYEGETVETTIDKTGVTSINNTKMPGLPSTGGMGTTLFTVGGIAVMIAAAGIFFASRRKRA